MAPSPVGGAARAQAPGCKDLTMALDALSSLGGFHLEEFEELLRLAEMATDGQADEGSSRPRDGPAPHINGTVVADTVDTGSTLAGE
jgi:hypothetical protein